MKPPIRALKSYPEVAAALHLSVPEVKRLERSALLKARDALERRGESFRALLALICPPPRP